MTTWWCKCTICGRNFPSVNRNETVCPDARKHAQIATDKRTRKPKDDKGGGKR